MKPQKVIDYIRFLYAVANNGERLEVMEFRKNYSNIPDISSLLASSQKAGHVEIAELENQNINQRHLRLTDEGKVAIAELEHLISEQNYMHRHDASRISVAKPEPANSQQN